MVTIRGSIKDLSFYSERRSNYDGILNKLLKLDTQGGSIDEDALVDELCKMHNMKNRPTIIHTKKDPPVENGKVVYGYFDGKNIHIYDKVNDDICVYANTMAHEFQHASDYEKGVAKREPIAYEEGDDAQYACEKNVSAAYKEQKNKDVEFSNRFGVIPRDQSSSVGVSRVDVDSDGLIRLRNLLQISANRLEEIRNSIERGFVEIGNDWNDNKYSEFYSLYSNRCNPKLQEMAEGIRGFVYFIGKKIEALEKYQNNRIPFGR